MKKAEFYFLKRLAALCATAVVVGCSGGGGGGTAATPADPSIVTNVYNSAPVSVCPNGGIQVDAGIDSNNNGVLDPAEVASTQYVCDGAPGATGQTGATGADGTNGSNGLNALVAVTSEPAGTNCAYAGKKISVGMDSNKNNILDNTEISSSDYICNGATGPIGPTGSTGPGVTWVNVTATPIQAQANTGYLADMSTQVTITLPASPTNGDVIQVAGVGTGGWKIAQNPFQSIITRNLPEANIGEYWIQRLGQGAFPAVASSADGAKIVALNYGGYIWTSANSGQNWIASGQTATFYWRTVASSTDGTKLVAGVDGGKFYTSINSGLTWSVSTSPTLSWRTVASSADGSKLVAGAYGGQMYTSSDSGLTWDVSTSLTTSPWASVASSADGAKLVAAVSGGQLYTSTDSGLNWTPRESSRNWSSVASSSDGTKLVAAAYGDQLYTSDDSGATWTPRDAIRYWSSVASSSDGVTLVAAELGGQLYTSINSGLIWTPRGSAKNWFCLASSSDGANLAAVMATADYVYTSSATKPSTTVGITGSISGGQYDAIELQYIGSNKFMILSHEGHLIVQ